jgi:hypothetical protein
MLEEALLRIAKRWNLFWNNAANYKELGVIEGCAHELAHALDLGQSFESLIQDMPDKKSNKHEASALRIEIAALAALGVRLSLQRLHASANWYGPAPSGIQLRAPLNRHEQDCVRRFAAAVNREVKDLCRTKRRTTRAPLGTTLRRHSN